MRKSLSANIETKLRSRSPIRSLPHVIGISFYIIFCLTLSILFFSSKNPFMSNVGYLFLGQAVVIFCHFVQTTFRYETNRSDVLYLRSYQTDQHMNEQSDLFEFHKEHSTSIEWSCHFALLPEYDLIGLIRPTSSDFESFISKSRLFKTQNVWLLEQVDNEVWQTSITSLLNICHAAIIECSNITSGINWEIEEAVKILGQDKLLLIADAKYQESVSEISNVMNKISDQGRTGKNDLFSLAVIRYYKAELEFRSTVKQRIKLIAPLSKRQRIHNIRIYYIREFIFYQLYIGWALMTYSIISTIYLFLKSLIN